MEGDVISMHDIFGFKQTGVDGDRRRPRATSTPRASGRNAWSGCRRRGVSLPARMFEQRNAASASRFR